MSGPDFGHCPACYSDLKIEEDDRMAPSGYAVFCDNKDCPDGGGAWPASLRDVREWKAYCGEVVAS